MFMKLPVLTRRAFVRDVSALGVASLVSAGPRSGLGQRTMGVAPSDPSFADKVDKTTLHRLEPVSVEHVVINDDFWAPKRKVWQEVTLRDCFAKFESDRGGAINNFDKVRAGQTGGHAGPPWTDGLVYEMIRAASDFLASHPDQNWKSSSTAISPASLTPLRSIRLDTSIHIH